MDGDLLGGEPPSETNLMDFGRQETSRADTSTVDLLDFGNSAAISSNENPGALVDLLGSETPVTSSPLENVFGASANPPPASFVHNDPFGVFSQAPEGNTGKEGTTDPFATSTNDAQVTPNGNSEAGNVDEKTKIPPSTSSLMSFESEKTSEEKKDSEAYQNQPETSPFITDAFVPVEASSTAIPTEVSTIEAATESVTPISEGTTMPQQIDSPAVNNHEATSEMRTPESTGKDSIIEKGTDEADKSEPEEEMETIERNEEEPKPIERNEEYPKGLPEELPKIETKASPDEARKGEAIQDSNLPSTADKSEPEEEMESIEMNEEEPKSIERNEEDPKALPEELPKVETKSSPDEAPKGEAIQDSNLPSTADKSEPEEEMESIEMNEEEPKSIERNEEDPKALPEELPKVETKSSPDEAPMGETIQKSSAPVVAKAAPITKSHSTNTTGVSFGKGFASLKNMAGNMASRHAANVAAAQKEASKPSPSRQKQGPSNGFAGFKSMAGSIAAKGKAGMAERVAAVNVPQQLAGVQVPQRFTKIGLFGNNNNNTSNSRQEPLSTITKEINEPAPVKTKEDPSPVINNSDSDQSAVVTSSSGSNPSKPATSNQEDATPAVGTATKDTVATPTVPEETKTSVAETTSQAATALHDLETTKQTEESVVSVAVVSESVPTPLQSDSNEKDESNGRNNDDTPTPQFDESYSKETSMESQTATSNEMQSTPTVDASIQEKNYDHRIEGLEKELEAARALISELQDKAKKEKAEEQQRQDTVLMELQANLEKEMTKRAEAEETARIAKTKSQRLEEEMTAIRDQSKSSIEILTNRVEELSKDREAMETELVEIREERDEQARKEMALTTRLNAAKKKEAVKANAAEHYEEQVDQLESSVKDYKSQVDTLTAERQQLQSELTEWKEYAEKRTKQLEMALNDEKKLNDERKRKMKSFVEAKTEEVRVAKADYLSLQSELDQNAHSLKELNQRYKQLHTQWVQSQTRNRELQRDAMRMKKDSEKMHKVGDSLEARLSRSAQQSEDHKNKRIHARNELMSVLGQLEAERAVNQRLQESIKLTFTPKALSQQQMVQEALDEFEGALQKLSTRVGRPVPPSMENDGFSDKSDENDGALGDTDDVDEGKSSAVTLSEINSNKVIEKLENETQRVSHTIMAFSTSIERMHMLLDGGGTRNCVDVLSQLLQMNSTNVGGSATIPPGATRRAGRTGQRYGQISPNLN